MQAYILELRATRLPSQFGDKATESQERIPRSYASGASELLHHKGGVSGRREYKTTIRLW